MRAIVEKIREDKFEPDVIIGFARGGAIPATVLAYEFSSSILDIIQPGFVAYKYTADLINEGYKVLVVEDIVDTGKTYQALLDVVETRTDKSKMQSQFRFASVIYNDSLDIEHKPAYIGETIEREHNKNYITFWWENVKRKT